MSITINPHEHQANCQHIRLITDVIDVHICLKITHVDTLVPTYTTAWDYFEPGVRLVFTLDGQTHLRFDGGDGEYWHIYQAQGQGLLFPINQKTLGDKCFVQGRQSELVIFCNYYYLENLGISPMIIKMFRNAHLIPFTIDMNATARLLSQIITHYYIHKTTPKKLINLLTKQVFKQVCQDNYSYQYHHRIIQAGQLLQHCEQIPSIDMLAKQCLTNRTTLQKEFQNIFGVSVIKYGREYRLYVALNALRRGESVGGAAYLARYDNPECFSKAFKQFFGRTPSAFSVK
ncbi:helix-turn-helix transcriptional regulator [Moraxella equi]|uniref:DNA-binding transcriptional regulator AraC n=1 Tax=Moraxella equi TaxID=60442 RepID=A0A378QT43_9GAMM|nr:response regulator transcription factor [Moraxella equi]OPH34026.1 hypothetical protein B5J93_12300 [Moraxella equi]STZ04079.1 DNA-binding transcriptional regulator AraC [Moraxella equi]